MKGIKCLFLISLFVISFCAVNTLGVQAQEDTIIYILSDGSFYSSTGEGAAILKEDNVYTLQEDLVGFALAIQCNDIVIDGAGYSMSGGGTSEAGIDMTSASGVTIKNLNIQGYYFYGILLYESTGNTFTDNSISGNTRGLYIYNSTGNTFTNNNIILNDIGMDIRYSPSNIFRNNNFNNEHNIVVFGDLISEYSLNIDTTNTVDEDKKIYYLIGKSNLVVSPTTYPDVGILALVTCQNITVQDLELTNNGQGLILAYTTNSKVFNNIIKDNHNGILLFASTSNEISDNQFTQNFRAIQLSRSSKNNRFTLNNVTGNEQGILLFDSTLNTFTANTVQNNSMGIGFSSSSNNMIYSNYFVDNSEYQVYDAGMADSTVANSTNYWFFDYPIGGNYWSDYSGIDVMSGENQDEEGSDSFGDTPHIIYSGNQDDYPLLPYGSPFGVSIISPESKAYNPDAVTLTYSVSEEDATIRYSLDGQANVTITGSTTLSGLSEGTHTITVYATSTDGTEKSDTVTFTVSEEAETPTEPEGNNNETEGLPTTLIAVILLLAAVGVAALYFLVLRK